MKSGKPDKIISGVRARLDRFVFAASANPRNPRLSNSIAFGFLGLFLLYLVASGGIEGSGLVWAFIYPPMVMFGLGIRIGLPIVTGFVLLCGLSVLLPRQWLGWDYPAAFQARWLAALAFVALVSTIFERSRHRAQQRLQAEVEVRRRAEQELQLAKEAAEQAARAKGGFLADMSHELRTPLTSLLGLNGLLLEGELDPGQRELAETMMHSGQHLVAIINDILDLSKLAAGQLVLERMSLDPAELTREVIKLFSASAGAKGLLLAVEPAEDLPERVLGDPRRIRQVLTNLVGNAVKFTAAGQVVVRVQATAAEPGQAALGWVVEDTGPGVPEHLQSLIFDEFQQGDGSTPRLFGGTGLGLTISQRLVQAMGGTIAVSSRPGQGSAFRFELRLELAGRTVVAETTADCDPGPGGRELAQRKLLVVEDDADNRLLMQLVFERLGARVELACDGQEALDRYESCDYDLILMDCHMPRMDGYRATEAIRRRQAELGRRRIPIVAVTANVTEENQAQCLGSGMDGYLIKPFDAETLERIARRYVCLPSPVQPDA